MPMLYFRGHFVLMSMGFALTVWIYLLRYALAEFSLLLHVVVLAPLVSDCCLKQDLRNEISTIQTFSFAKTLV